MNLTNAQIRGITLALLSTLATCVVLFVAGDAFAASSGALEDGGSRMFEHIKTGFKWAGLVGLVGALAGAMLTDGTSFQTLTRGGFTLMLAGALIGVGPDILQAVGLSGALVTNL